MAVPNIVRILPYGAPIDFPVIGGPTMGGALVEIYGGGFRLASRDSTNRASTAKPVDVLFGGVPAPRIAVARSNLIRVVTPECGIPLTGGSPEPGVGFVDVEVRNLDDAGAPIPGESAVVPSGYAYFRPRLDSLAKGYVTRLVEAVIDQLRRHVLLNTLTHQALDFDPNTGDAFGLIDNATLPALVLIGPRLVENRLQSIRGSQTIDPARVPGLPPEERHMIATMPYTVDLSFDLLGMTGSGRYDDTGASVSEGGRVGLLNLMDTVITYMRRRPLITLDRDPADPARGQVSFELQFSNQNSLPSVEDNASGDVHTFRSQIVVQGVHVERIGHVFGDAAIGAVPLVEQILVDYSRLG